MRKSAVRFTVNFDDSNSHCLQQSRHNNASNRVHGIQNNGEPCAIDSLCIYKRVGEYSLYMLFCKIFFGDNSQIVYIRKFKNTGVHNRKQLFPILRIKKLPPLVEKFKGIPLFWIVRCSENNSTICPFEDNRHLYCGCRGQPCIDYINTASCEGPANNMVAHLPGDTRVSSKNNSIPAFFARAMFYER